MLALPHSENRGITYLRVFDMSSENEINTVFCPKQLTLLCYSWCLPETLTQQKEQDID